MRTADLHDAKVVASPQTAPLVHAMLAALAIPGLWPAVTRDRLGPDAATLKGPFVDAWVVSPLSLRPFLRRFKEFWTNFWIRSEICNLRTFSAC